MFDVYVPRVDEESGQGRVWLIDINPWTQRTDPLLFSWMEVLGMRVPPTDGGKDGDEGDALRKAVLRLQIGENGGWRVAEGMMDDQHGHGSESESESDSEEEEELPLVPEVRIVNRDDPEAYSFNTPQYSAHKLPREVVDASAVGGSGLREFMGQWREIVARQEREDGDGEGTR